MNLTQRIEKLLSIATEPKTREQICAGLGLEYPDIYTNQCLRGMKKAGLAIAILKPGAATTFVKAQKTSKGLRADQAYRSFECRSATW